MIPKQNVKFGFTKIIYLIIISLFCMSLFFVMIYAHLKLRMSFSDSLNPNSFTLIKGEVLANQAEYNRKGRLLGTRLIYLKDIESPFRTLDRYILDEGKYFHYKFYKEKIETVKNISIGDSVTVKVLKFDIEKNHLFFYPLVGNFFYREDAVSIFDLTWEKVLVYKANYKKFYVHEFEIMKLFVLWLVLIIVIFSKFFQ